MSLMFLQDLIRNLGIMSGLLTDMFNVVFSLKYTENQLIHRNYLVLRRICEIKLKESLERNKRNTVYIDVMRIGEKLKGQIIHKYLILKFAIDRDEGCKPSLGDI